MVSDGMNGSDKEELVESVNKPENNEDAVSEIAQLREEAKANHEKYLRALADFENYKKRALKERSELIKYQGENIIVELLEVVDNFERAIANQDADSESLRTGLEMIYKQLTDLLAKLGVRGESAIDREFNPEIHQALSQIISAEHKPGTVVSELKKPYYYKDKLLRVGQVVVAGESDSGGASENESLNEPKNGSDT